MLNIKPNEMKFIKENIENADDILNTLDINDILDPLDAWITANGFDDNYDLTDEGRIAQRIYDSLYANN